MKYPPMSRAKNHQLRRNIVMFLIADSGEARFSTSIWLGISFRKKSHNTASDAIILRKFGRNIVLAYSQNPIWKYPAVTMLVRLEMTSGLEALSPINPPAIKNANIAMGFSLRYFIFAKIIGVRISAAPSLAKNADTSAPSIII